MIDNGLALFFCPVLSCPVLFHSANFVHPNETPTYSMIRRYSNLPVFLTFFPTSPPVYLPYQLLQARRYSVHLIKRVFHESERLVELPPRIAYLIYPSYHPPNLPPNQNLTWTNPKFSCPEETIILHPSMRLITRNIIKLPDLTCMYSSPNPGTTRA